MGEVWTYFTDHHSDIMSWLWTTVWLAGVPLLIGLALALPIGWVASRYRWTYPPITSLAGLLYTIPSLVLFLVLPGVLGTGILSPINVAVALTIYTIALLVRTVADGLDSVSPTRMAAASAMGYTDRQRLFAVQLPLAVPVIGAGLRVAAVSNVSLVSVGVGHRRAATRRVVRRRLHLQLGHPDARRADPVRAARAGLRPGRSWRSCGCSRRGSERWRRHMTHPVLADLQAARPQPRAHLVQRPVELVGPVRPGGPHPRAPDLHARSSWSSRSSSRCRIGLIIGHTGRGVVLVVGLANGLRAVPTLGLRRSCSTSGSRRRSRRRSRSRAGRAGRAAGLRPGDDRAGAAGAAADPHQHLRGRAERRPGRARRRAGHGHDRRAGRAQGRVPVRAAADHVRHPQRDAAGDRDGDGRGVPAVPRRARPLHQGRRGDPSTTRRPATRRWSRRASPSPSSPSSSMRCSTCCSVTSCPPGCPGGPTKNRPEPADESSDRSRGGAFDSCVTDQSRPQTCSTPLKER